MEGGLNDIKNSAYTKTKFGYLSAMTSHNDTYNIVYLSVDT